jgi:hypothetical protein
MKQTYKVYVETGVVFHTNGEMIPKWIQMGDERYEIERVLDCRRAASLKAGGCGLRYTIRCRGKDAFLFYEDTEPGFWFVESRVPVEEEL